MIELLHVLAPLFAVLDAALFASFWLWKGHGKPLPKRFGWMKTRPGWRWFFTRWAM